ncbi:MAG: hypothetical protein ACM32E_16780 [Gemmatimonadota bacterium]
MSVTEGTGYEPTQGWPAPGRRQPDAWDLTPAEGQRTLGQPVAGYPQPPAQPSAPRRSGGRGRRIGVIAAAGVLVVAAAAGYLVTRGGGKQSTAPTGYTFHTYNNHADPTFNQLLGITKGGVIAGYFGSGEAGHPNKGYQLLPGGQGDYVNENFPGAVQTQVTGLNDTGVTVGFYSGMNNANGTNDNFGFYAIGATDFHPVNFPSHFNTSPPVNQLLGVNDHGVAVGFFVNGQGNNRGYEYNIHTHHFSRVKVAGAVMGRKAPSLTAAAISNTGAVAGFYVPTGSNVTDAFLLLANGKFWKIAHPGASMTQAFGVNDHNEVVGAYTVGSGNNAKTHGFTWTPGHGFSTVDDPHGKGATAINGVNDAGALVGFYTDAKGNTDGMLAQPRH